MYIYEIYKYVNIYIKNKKQDIYFLMSYILVSFKPLKNNEN